MARLECVVWHFRASADAPPAAFLAPLKPFAIIPLPCVLEVVSPMLRLSGYNCSKQVIVRFILVLSLAGGTSPCSMPAIVLYCTPVFHGRVPTYSNLQLLLHGISYLFRYDLLLVNLINVRYLFDGLSLEC